jgi:hypothetical protein
MGVPSFPDPHITLPTTHLENAVITVADDASTPGEQSTSSSASIMSTYPSKGYCSLAKSYLLNE